MNEPLATVQQIAGRIGEPITSDTDIALANEVLEEASFWVRHYGLSWPNPETAPPVAVRITVAAAARGFQNPGGLETERAEIVTLGRFKEYGMGCELTPAEIDALQSVAGKRRGRAVSLRATRPHFNEKAASRTDRVPVKGGSPFPLPEWPVVE